MIKGTLGLSLYSIFGIISTVVLFVYNICQINQKKKFLSKYHTILIAKNMPKWGKSIFSNKTLWAFFEIIVISSVQYLFVGNVNSSFGRLVGTGANYFGLLFIIPFFIIVTCLILRIDPFMQLDMITPAFPLALIFVKLACFSYGCCRGFQMEYGFYNFRYELFEFPSQLLEVFVAVLLFVFFVIYKRKAKVGTLFPLYMILYSGLRFFTEFTRREENIFFVFKKYHILCVIGVVVGVLQLLFVSKLCKKIRIRLGYSSNDFT